MSFHLTSVLFRQSFRTDEMDEIFGERGFIERFLTVEAALARAGARAGVVPKEMADEITRKSSIEYVDMDIVTRNVEEMGLFSIALIEAWKESFDEAGEYIHWGASSQDISDTVLVLQLRDAYEIIQNDLAAIVERLETLVEQYRDTPMIGRTQYRHGPPITFGFKVATWLDELRRHAVRLDELRDRAFVVQLAGASGTMSALGEDGVDVLSYFAEELDLGVPPIGWTATRDRFAEVLNVFAMIASTLGRISRQLLRLNRPEFEEITETVPDSEIGSSTNPHKRNPVYSQINVGLARLVRSHARTMNELMETEDERSRSTWYVEFAVIPESTIYLGRLLHNSRENLDGLNVHPEKMMETVRDAGPLVASESVMMALAEKVGRQTAHEIVQENARRAIEDTISFPEALEEDPRIQEHFSAAEIRELTDPTTYTGLATHFADEVVEDGDSE